MANFDALVVLGKNIGIGWTRNRIKKSKNFLSDRSELSVIAGGLLYKTGNYNKIILSGGKTAGKNIPSEAQAMKTFLMEQFPEIPDKSIILEDVSVDTLQNVEEIKKIADQMHFKNMAVLTTPEHTRRTKMLFKKGGIKIEVLSSSEALERFSPDQYAKYKYKTNPFEIIVENSAYVVQLIPVIGELAHHIVKKSRSR